MNRILVVMTPSRTSRMALDEALAMAKPTGVRVRLARVLGMHRSTHAVLRAEAWLDHAERRVPAELRDGTVALVGPPSLAIRRAAEAYAADVVVIGAPTYAALDRIGLDSAFIEEVGPKLLIVRPLEKSELEVAAPPPPASRRAHDDHPILEATTLAGAASGAVAGAIAGLPGVLVGAGVGSALGMIAGRALELAEDRAELRDHELDDAIGVTHGAVGLGSVDVARDTLPPEASLAHAGRFLDDEHRRIEEIAAAMLEACTKGDWLETNAKWAWFEPALRVHMTREEHAVFPLFRVAHPEETAKLLAEHDELRRRLDEITTPIEVQPLSVDRLAELVRLLDAHGRTEEAVLYPWVDAAVETENLKKPLAA
jgi:nucleotide-binding universal stress UspA family protein/hemerythrin superfamily protein